MEGVQHEPSRVSPVGSVGTKWTMLVSLIESDDTGACAEAGEIDPDKISAEVRTINPLGRIGININAARLVPGNQKSGRRIPAVTSAPLATPISASPATRPAAKRIPGPLSSAFSDPKIERTSAPRKIVTLSPNGR